MSTVRGLFGSKLGIILATAGSAVGLGNVWRFPYMTGHNGGAAFIIIYIAFMLLLGMPGMVCEFIVGRHGATNVERQAMEVGGIYGHSHIHPYPWLLFGGGGLVSQLPLCLFWWQHSRRCRRCDKLFPAFLLGSGIAHNLWFSLYPHHPFRGGQGHQARHRACV